MTELRDGRSWILSFYHESIIAKFERPNLVSDPFSCRNESIIGTDRDGYP
jgi:hypothetical protein